MRAPPKLPPSLLPSTRTHPHTSSTHAHSSSTFLKHKEATSDAAPRGLPKRRGCARRHRAFQPHEEPLPSVCCCCCCPAATSTLPPWPPWPLVLLLLLLTSIMARPHEQCRRRERGETETATAPVLPPPLAPHHTAAAAKTTPLHPTIPTPNGHTSTTTLTPSARRSQQEEALLQGPYPFSSHPPTDPPTHSLTTHPPTPIPTGTLSKIRSRGSRLLERTLASLRPGDLWCSRARRSGPHALSPPHPPRCLD